MKALQTVIGAAIAAIGVLPGADAAPVTIFQTISLGQLLKDSSTSVHFDVGGLLASQGLSPQDISSASLVVYGVSDPDYQARYTQYGEYHNQPQLTYMSGYTFYYKENIDIPVNATCYDWYTGEPYSCVLHQMGRVTRSVTTYHYNTSALRQNSVMHVDNIADRMTVTAGSSTAVATASTTTSSSTAYGDWVLDLHQGGYDIGWGDSYSQYRDVYQAISGDLRVSMGLDSESLTNLMLDGMLDIGIAAFGQFALLSASLTFSADSTSGLNPATEVPEPNSALLTASALAALLALRARQRGESK